MKRNKKRIILLGCVGVVLALILVFSLLYWDVIKHLCDEMISGVAIAGDYICDLGIVGVLAITLLIIVFFFFPVISSVPIQIASSVSYGLLFGILHVTLSVWIASQLAFLFTRCFNALKSKKHYEKQLEMEAKIKSSNRSIIYFMFLAYLAPFVPFMLIHTVAASSGMKWWKYALVTLFGPIPDIVVTLWLGEKVTSSSPTVSYIVLVCIIVVVALSLIYKDKIVDWIFTPKKEKNNG